MPTLRLRPALACLLLAAALRADEPAPTSAIPAGFSLRTALELALKQSPGLRVQEAGVERKSAILEQASGAFDWNGAAAVSTGKDRTPVPGLPGTEPVDSSTQTAYTLGVGKLFRNGVSVQPSIAASVTDSRMPGVPSVGAAELNFQIDVPLLRGLGIDSTGAAEAAARGDVAVARLLYQHALAAQAYGTAAAYWNSRAADEVLLLQRDVEKAAERLVDSTQTLVDSRIYPPAFLLQAQANLRDKRTVRIEAELAARNARIALGRALGGSPEALVSTPTPGDSFPALGPTDIALLPEAQTGLIRRALDARADLSASRASLVPLNILATAAEHDLKPRVDLSVRAGYKGLSTNNSLTGPLNHRLTGANGAIGVSVDWPFRNSYQRGVLRERQSDVRAAEAQTADLSQAIAGEVLLALEQVRLRADAVRSASETVEIARRALTAQYEQLRSGEGTLLDVISLENLSVGARIRYIDAHASYAVAVAQLRYALGEVFDHSAGNGAAFALADLGVLPSLISAPSAR